ncbi:hypothetical protein [Trichloromonas sp.]|uniref:hypothetical protein n=1 Tax=Trichloromonas sp. TaxID=3069249 RepID=UPI002A3CE0D4|nr:hypothetical protein [Trichloromonas sp.]
MSGPRRTSIAVVLGEEVSVDVLMPGNDRREQDDEALAASFYDGRITIYLGRARFATCLFVPPPHVGISWNQ